MISKLIWKALDKLARGCYITRTHTPPHFMLISLNDDEYLITCTALTIYSYMLNGNASLEVDIDVDMDTLNHLNHKVSLTIDGDFSKVEKLLKKLSIAGEINANFPDQSKLC